MFTIAAQIVLHSVVEAMDWRNNVYVPCAQIVVNIFRHCYCDQFRFRQTLKAYISEKRFAAGCLVVIPGHTRQLQTGTQDGWGREMHVEILLVTGHSIWTRKPSTASGAIRKESTAVEGKAA